MMEPVKRKRLSYSTLRIREGASSLPLCKPAITHRAEGPRVQQVGCLERDREQSACLVSNRHLTFLRLPLRPSLLMTAHSAPH